MSYEKSIDNYSLSLYKQCPMQYNFRINYELVPSAPNLPAQFGISIHEGLSTFYMTGDIGSACEAFVENWKPYDDLDLKGLYNSPRGILILTNYIENHNNIRALHVEVGAAVEMPNTQWVLTGRIDLIGQLDDVVYVIDHKTRAKSLNTFCISPNYQMLGYSKMATEVLGTSEVVPIMVNLIKVDKYMKEDVLRMTHYPQLFELDQFEKDFIYWTSRIEESIESNRWAAVGIDYICGWCEYKELCSNRGLHDKLLEAGVYKISSWKPY